MPKPSTSQRIEIPFPPLHAAQYLMATCEARFIVPVCGRRFGKTSGFAQKLTQGAVGGGLYWWVAPNYTPTGEAGWDELRTYADAIKTVYPATKVWDSEPYGVQFPNKGKLEVRSGENPQKLRSRGLRGAVLDEAAFMAREVFEDAIELSLTDHKGWAVFPTTPWGKNYVYEYYHRARTIIESLPKGSQQREREWVQRDNPHGDKDWAAFRFTTYDNPFIDADELDRLERTMPAMRFRREILAEFVDESGLVFRLVTDAAVIDPETCAYTPDDVYVMGLDWGRVHDNTAIEVVNATRREHVYDDAFTDVDWDVQRNRVIAAYNKWKPSVIWGEENSIGADRVQALQKLGLPIKPFKTTGQSKGPLIDGLSLAIERGDLKLLNKPEVIRELTDYEAKPLPSGGYRYSAPRGGYDDRVIALALAWHGCNSSTQAGTLSIGTAPQALADLFTSF